MSTKLYHHKTSGGAEYLTDTFIPWTHNGKSGREGTVTQDTKICIRIDGDIKKDAEVITDYRADLLDALKIFLDIVDNVKAPYTNKNLALAIRAARRVIEQAEPHKWTAEEILKREG